MRKLVISVRYPLDQYFVVETNVSSDSILFIANGYIMTGNNCVENRLIHVEIVRIFKRPVVEDDMYMQRVQTRP